MSLILLAAAAVLAAVAVLAVAKVLAATVSESESFDGFSAPFTAVCINMARSADRRKRMEAQAREHGLAPLQFLTATTPAELPEQAKTLARTAGVHLGRMGCWESHLRVYRSVPERHVVLVLEDDVELCAGFKDKLAAVVDELARVSQTVDWDVCMVGRSAAGGTEKACDGSALLVHSSVNFTGTHAMFVRPTAALLEKLDWRNLSEGAAKTAGQNFAVDVLLSLLSRQNAITVLAVRENLAKQREDAGSLTEMD